MPSISRASRFIRRTISLQYSLAIEASRPGPSRCAGSPVTIRRPIARMTSTSA